MSLRITHWIHVIHVNVYNFVKQRDLDNKCFLTLQKGGCFHSPALCSSALGTSELTLKHQRCTNDLQCNYKRVHTGLLQSYIMTRLILPGIGLCVYLDVNCCVFLCLSLRGGL